MRCFFAIPLSDEIRDYLYEFMNKLKKDLKKYSLKIRFVAKKNLHISLLFIGEIKEEKLEKIKKKAREIKFESFKFKLDKLGFFPNEDFVRVLWVGVKPEREVIGLQKKIDESLLDLKRDHEFGAHLTLARVRHNKQSSKIVPYIKKISIKKIEHEVNSFGLYESVLHKDGSKYFLVEEFKAKK